MKKKFLWIVLRAYCVLLCCCGVTESSPTEAAAAANNLAVNRFQGGLQQQNLFTILTSIEERLRNLDNIYTMQLSQTLENKLDQYSRRLESLDTKIIRLEALVMLNLDKISENISTKNFKDDVTKTNIMKKMDTVYEGISHRLNYMDRKHETNFAKVQAKIDSTSIRLEKLEEVMTNKESDVESELSDAIFAIDDLKTTYGAMEEKLLNITLSTFNITKDNQNFLKEIHVDHRKSINRLHDNIVENLEYMDNKTLAHIKTTKDNNIMLKTMRIELKNDFNDYANKVADMNSYIWKNRDTIGEDLKEIATAVNTTKIEVQNGVRNLMLQIGKLSSKDNAIPLEADDISGIDKKLTTNFEKILSNQDLFLESCYRVQMDESQIESEISDMLQKFIDMLEKKLASEMKDIKNLEKSLKNHDSRVNRNLYQSNTNTISLFEKFTVHDQETKMEIKRIGLVLDALFAFVQNGSLSTVDTEAILDQLNRIEDLSKTAIPPSNNQNIHIIQEVAKKIETANEILKKVEYYLNKTFEEQNIDDILSRVLPKHLDNRCIAHNGTMSNSSNKTKVDEDTMKVIVDIFGTNPELPGANLKSSQKPDVKSKCKQDYSGLIDIRQGGEMCEDEEEKPNRRKKKRKWKKKKPYQIDIRGNFTSDGDTQYEEYEESTENTTENLDNGIDESDSTTESVSTTNESITNSSLMAEPNTTTNTI